jgi:WD40 repeat protein/tRNA A-37 threonylcarbamoyl transferase component Bud32
MPEPLARPGPEDARAEEGLTHAATGWNSTPPSPSADPTWAAPQASVEASAAQSPPGYQVLEEIGRGGMGVVYKARQLKANRLVALKVLLSGAHASAEERARFLAEAEAVARLQHPGIVQVFEIGEHDGRLFFSLELCPGGGLDRMLGGTPLPPREAAVLCEQLARAVQAAHDQGVVHRDLKPANVLFSAAGLAKVADFGLAKRLEEQGQTATGAVVGTPSYMAPEQAAGRKDVGPAADVYSLGAILYECLTGRPPFRAATLLETLLQVREEEPVSVRHLQPGAPRDLETVCLKCLTKEPGRRYASANDLADELVRWLGGQTIEARPAGRLERAWKWVRRNPALAGSLLAVALALLLGAGAAVWFALRADDNAQRADANARRADAKAEEAEATAATARRAMGRAYRSDMRLTQRFWDDGLVGPLGELLDRQRPEHIAGLDLRGFEWFYWARQVRGAATLRGHAGWVNSVAFSPDGKRIVSGSADRTVKVWDAETVQEILSFLGNGGSVISVAFSPDGKRIVSGGNDKLVRVWDAETGQEKLTLKGHANLVNSVAISAGGNRIVSGSYDKTLKVWDAETGREMFSLKGHAGVVYSVAISPDGKRIVSGSKDRTVRVWDAETRQEKRTLNGHTGLIVSVAISPDGKHIASGSHDRTVRVWDAETGQCLLTLEGHTDSVSSVAFSPDGKRIVSGSADRTVKVWDAKTGRATRALKGHTDPVYCVAISPDGQCVFSGSRSGRLKMWRLEGDPSVRVLAGHISQVTAVAISPDGTRIASAGGDWRIQGRAPYSSGELKLWDARGRARDLLTQEAGVTCVAFSPDGALLACGSGAWDAKANRYTSGEVRLFSAAGRPLATLRGHSSSVMSVAFSPDGSLLASAALDGSVGVWDLAGRQKAFDLPKQQKAVTAVAFSPDGALLAAAGFDWTVTLYDLRRQAQTRALAPGFTVSGLAFSPDGARLVVTGYFNGAIPVYEVATGKRLLGLTGHTDFPTGVAFSPDGRRIATCGEDRTVRLWDAASGQEVLTLRGHTHVVRGVAFSKDGHRLLSGGWDKTVRVLDATPLPDEPPPAGPGRRR